MKDSATIYMERMAALIEEAKKDGYSFQFTTLVRYGENNGDEIKEVYTDDKYFDFNIAPYIKW